MQKINRKRGIFIQNRNYKTKEEVLTRGQEAIGIPLKLIDKTGRLSVGKGAIGTVLEESWFGYSVNSESAPDFEEAGVELKATPYLKTLKGLRAKERLVCNIINYMTEYQNTFETSSFYKKCNTMLIMSYEHHDGILKGDFTIDKAVLFSFPTEDLLIIRQDWEKIIAKIKDGKAHEISERDTFYLEACTKGATAATVRKQPFSSMPAKQRAYSLKQSYMSYILQTYIFGNSEDEHIFKAAGQLAKAGFEEYIREQISPYIGKSQEVLKNTFQINSSAKNLNPKNSIHTEKHLHFKTLLFWQLPVEDTAEVERVWKQAVSIIRAGVKLEKVSYGTSFKVENNLPKERESAVAHIRAHSKAAAYIINGE